MPIGTICKSIRCVGVVVLKSHSRCRCLLADVSRDSLRTSELREYSGPVVGRASVHTVRSHNGNVFLSLKVEERFLYFSQDRCSHGLIVYIWSLDNRDPNGIWRKAKRKVVIKCCVNRIGQFVALREYLDRIRRKLGPATM